MCLFAALVPLTALQLNQADNLLFSDNHHKRVLFFFHKSMCFFLFLQLMNICTACSFVQMFVRSAEPAQCGR